MWFLAARATTERGAALSRASLFGFSFSQRPLSFGGLALLGVRLSWGSLGKPQGALARTPPVGKVMSFRGPHLQNLLLGVLHASAWFKFQGSGFRVQGSGFRVQGSGFRVWGKG